MTDAARRAAEGVARASYGRLVALLASRSHDIAAAEDALAEAFRIALESWPTRGVPERPEAWLLTVARRTLGHAVRANRVREAGVATLTLIHDEMRDCDPGGFPDHRLRLMFACAHPAIDETVHTPLMLQAVLGLDATRIGAAFLTTPAAMGQRLVRAKAKIRDAGIRLEEPEPGVLSGRLAAVLSAVYAAYGSAWSAAPGTETPDGLAEEAVYLGRLVVGLAPDEPEARGLLALMLHCEARRPARRTQAGAYVAFDDQDTSLWSRPMIVEAESHLLAASRARRFGRFQTEAAIQSLHVERGLTGRTNTTALISLYDLLVDQTPSIGALVARAAVYGEAFGPESGLDELNAIAPERGAAYQPFWAVRGHLLGRASRKPEALASFEMAIGLSEDAAVRAYLQAKAAVFKT